MRILGSYTDDNEQNFYADMFVQILGKKYDIVYSEEPDFIIFSGFNSIHAKTHFLDYDCVRIFQTGENIRTDWNLADYGIDFDFMDFGDRHLRLPHYCMFVQEHNKRPMNKREKFCAYIVSNGGLRGIRYLREDFFKKLNTYKKVDSGGRHRNNIGHFVEDKHKWLQNYKFNLCFENSSYPGYLTEKLFDAYNAGCVPIYWGDTSLRVGFADNAGGGGFDISDTECIDMRVPEIPLHLIEYKINPKAFINAHNFPNLNALLEEVKRIDNDDKAYETMRNEPLFLDNFNPQEFYEKKVFEFFDYIFSQGADLAFRRGVGQHLASYQHRIKAGLNLSKDALNVAKFITLVQRKGTNKFTKKWTKMIKKVKFWHKELNLKA